MKTHTLNVWPEHSTGKWIVSYTQVGTNNEKVIGEFWQKEDANRFAAMENQEASAPALVAALERLCNMDGYLEANADSGISQHDLEGQAYRAAREAIALARGSNPSPTIDPRDAEIARLRGMLSDAAFQLGRLTGPNLETYARTFAALAEGGAR